MERTELEEDWDRLTYKDTGMKKRNKKYGLAANK